MVRTGRSATSAALPIPLVEQAPAKVNLTLRVLGRRADGYHEIESLVMFAAAGDRLTFVRGAELALSVAGPTADETGTPGDNLVLKAARALSCDMPGFRLGRFRLDKKLPVAAGLGGGSADAAAALRLLARANRLHRDDPRLYAAARATGADVPVCLDPRTRLMRGIGEVLSAPLAWPSFPAVLVNPGVAVPTRDVFAALRLAAVPRTATADIDALALLRTRAQALAWLATQANDLEAAATAIAPAVAEVLAALRALVGCQLARMSGSGATCFALFGSTRAATAGAKILRSRFPRWWVRASVLGGAR
jgi:4-diphosphocytidyl-2-C-methyl-D-erythritol kinase